MLHSLGIAYEVGETKVTVERETIEMALDGSTVKIGGQAVMTCSWTYTDLLSTVVSVSQILGER